MLRCLLAACAVVVLALAVNHGYCAEISAGADALNIGSGLQLFTDDYLIQEMKNSSLVIHHPDKREVVLGFDSPWETNQGAYITVLQDSKLRKYRMYYRGGSDHSYEYTCVAESPDGINWTKPNLGIIDYNGSTDNNIIWKGRKKGYWESHNFTPFIDESPNCKPEERYKAVALGRYEDEKGETRKMLVALISPDGIHWKRLREEPIIKKGSFDSQNVCFWDTVKNEYVVYLRDTRTANGKAYRSIRRASSKDFINWTDPQYVEFGDAPFDQLYTNGIIPYFRNPAIYLGFPMRFIPDRQEAGEPTRKVDSLSDAVFMSSHDGINFDRRFMEAYIRPGLDSNNWGSGHGNSTPAWGLLQTSPEEISIYICENCVGGKPHMRRYATRTDGFVSVNAPFTGGEFTTKPIVFKGNSLSINYATSAVGSVKVEIQDKNGNPITGFSLADCKEIWGDEIERTVSWKQGTDLGTLSGKEIRLKFAMKDADLYSIKFKEK